ncbi:centromere protein R isoform 1-T1 [Acanthopagrus schlegelii]
MPVRRALHMDNAHNHPASKIPVPARNQAPLTGTACSQAGKTKVTRHEQEVPETELEKLDSLRSKLEQSVDAFIKARKELEEIFSAEGSSEQGRFLTGSSTDLKTELKRHRELTSRVELSLKENKDLKHLSQGSVKKGSSYEFLKSIMG